MISLQAIEDQTGIPAGVLEVVLSLNWDDAAQALQDGGWEAWDANPGYAGMDHMDWQPDYRVAGPKGEMSWADMGGSTVNYH